jgi:hypothetical protein
MVFFFDFFFIKIIPHNKTTHKKVEGEGVIRGGTLEKLMAKDRYS